MDLQQFQQLLSLISQQSQIINIYKLQEQNETRNKYDKMSSVSNQEPNDMKNKVQERIKMMMKNKKLQKLTSEKDLNSQKPISVQQGKVTSKNLDDLFDNLKNFDHEQFSSNYIASSKKRMKSTTGDDAENNPMKAVHRNAQMENKKFALSSKGMGKEIYSEKQIMRKIPSEERLQKTGVSNQTNSKIRLKRPSSVIQSKSSNSANRSITSRTRRKRTSAADEKLIEDKIRECVDKSFTYGAKLQKYLEENGLNLEREKNDIFEEQVTMLRLIGSCKRHFEQETQNQEEASIMAAGKIEKEIISLIRKKYDKLKVISNCEKITDKISRLIEDRLNSLNKQEFI